MRIGINNRNKYKIKKDLRISKSNYGSQLDYSIESGILQKRLIYDNRKLITLIIWSKVDGIDITFDNP